MAGQRLLKIRQPLGDDAFVEIVVWKLPQSLPGSQPALNYRLAYVSSGKCMVRYDNEAGKGDHKHVSGCKTPVTFTDLDTLLRDFWRDVDQWRSR